MRRRAYGALGKGTPSIYSSVQMSDNEMVSFKTRKCRQCMATDGKRALCKSLVWMPRVPCRLRHVSANHVELVLLLVEIPETEPERNTRDKGNDSGGTIVP